MITSLENKTVKELTKLHQKKYRENSFLLLNEDLILKAYYADKLDKLVYTGELPFEFENAIEVSREVLNKIAKKDGLNYIGVGKPIEEKKNYGKRVILLDHLQDPLNIGRIMLLSALFGFDTVLLSESSADIYNEKALEASKGALFDINICHGDLVKEIDVLKKQGFKIYSTGLRTYSKELYEVKENEKMAIVLGNEGSGVREEIMDISDDIIKIDMHNIDSLNVAMAGAIVMHRFKNLVV